MLPKHVIAPLAKIRFAGRPRIIQFNRAHTGSGTALIRSQTELVELQTKFPHRPVRVSEYIPGPVFTNNNVVWGKKILVGNINYQITGLAPFTARPFATVGNDWRLPHVLLSHKQLKRYRQIAVQVGEKLARLGWKGLFGLDIIAHEKTGQLYLLEINARQPASATYESQLQQAAIDNEQLPPRSVSRSDTGGPANCCTTFAAHLGALLGLKNAGYKLIPLSDGAQIVQKKTENAKLKIQKKNWEKNKFTTMAYNNTELESDAMRIQSPAGIMQSHNVFNARGGLIIKLIKTNKNG